MQKFEVLHGQISTHSHLLASQSLAYVKSSKKKILFSIFVLAQSLLLHCLCFFSISCGMATIGVLPKRPLAL